MILSQLKEHLQRMKTASLFDLKVLLEIDPQILRQMLGLWIKKGKVRKQSSLEKCGTVCGKCDPLKTEIYEWVV